MLEDINIRKGTFQEAIKISNQIPEFTDTLSEQDFLKRTGDRTYLILVACDQEIPIGFKIGYDRRGDGSFYSWLGGVVPQYRRQGIARKLASMLENWVKLKGYDRVIVKTRNCFREMIQFLISTEYKLVKVIPQEDLRDNRLIFEKILS